MTNITASDIDQILKYFAGATYKAINCETLCNDAMEKCIELVKLDYHYLLIANSQGELSAHYPPQIIVLENELQSQNGNSRNTDTIYENIYEKRNLRESMVKARTARCRARFPIPVILYKGKHICRSATIAGGPEVYTRNSFDYFFGQSEPADAPGEVPEEQQENDCDSLNREIPDDISQTSDLGLFETVRQADINYLKILNVSTIVDLMVEKKKVKFGMYVTSSEKVDKESRYKDFSLISLPYPGCEFFLQYRENDYTPKGLVFDWSQSYVDADLAIPVEIASQLKVDWTNYKKWDLISLTQNYMRVLIRLLNETTSGILIHCISGWDRTPLFISLLRISLWADGVIHSQLSPLQILYFTLAYDWMMFGHNLSNRLEKGEEILHFCFHMLKFIVDEEYSILSQSSRKSKHNTSSGSTGSNNSIGVLRADSDTQLEGVLLEDTNGSNISLNSICSSNSNKDSDTSSTIPVLRLDSDELINGNSNSNETYSPPLPRSSPYGSHQRRTSPIAVPNRRQRQRTDSTSSLSGGSWQMVTGCGSLRSENNDICPIRGTAILGSDLSTESSSTCTLTDDSDGVLSLSRKTRLNEVRKVFGTHYGIAVGLKMKNASDSHLKSIVNTIAGSVGLL